MGLQQWLQLGRLDRSIARHFVCWRLGPGNSWTAWHCRTDSAQIHLPAQITKSRVGSESFAALNASFCNQAPQQPTCERVRRQTCRDAGLSVVSLRSRTRLAVGTQTFASLCVHLLHLFHLLAIRCTACWELPRHDVLIRRDLGHSRHASSNFCSYGLPLL